MAECMRCNRLIDKMDANGEYAIIRIKSKTPMMFYLCGYCTSRMFKRRNII